MGRYKIIMLQHCFSKQALCRRDFASLLSANLKTSSPPLKKGRRRPSAERGSSVGGPPRPEGAAVWRQDQLRVVDDVADITVSRGLKADPRRSVPLQPHHVTGPQRLRILVDRDHPRGRRARAGREPAPGRCAHRCRRTCPHRKAPARSGYETTGSAARRRPSNRAQPRPQVVPVEQGDIAGPRRVTAGRGAGWAGGLRVDGLEPGPPGGPRWPFTALTVRSSMAAISFQGLVEHVLEDQPRCAATVGSSTKPPTKKHTARPSDPASRRISTSTGSGRSGSATSLGRPRTGSDARIRAGCAVGPARDCGRSGTAQARSGGASWQLVQGDEGHGRRCPAPQSSPSITEPIRRRASRR